MEQYCKGYRSGGGPAIAVVKPKIVLEQWQVLKIADASDDQADFYRECDPTNSFNPGIEKVSKKALQLIRTFLSLLLLSE